MKPIISHSNYSAWTYQNCMDYSVLMFKHFWNLCQCDVQLFHVATKSNAHRKTMSMYCKLHVQCAQRAFVQACMFMRATCPSPASERPTFACTRKRRILLSYTGLARQARLPCCSRRTPMPFLSDLSENNAHMSAYVVRNHCMNCV